MNPTARYTHVPASRPVFRPTERWLVFENGERYRVWVWPTPLQPSHRGEAQMTAPPRPELRYVVFESAAERGCARLPHGAALDSLTPRQLLALFRRSQRLRVARRDVRRS